MKQVVFILVSLFSINGWAQMLVPSTLSSQGPLQNRICEVTREVGYSNIIVNDPSGYEMQLPYHERIPKSPLIKLISIDFNDYMSNDLDPHQVEFDALKNCRRQFDRDVRRHCRDFKAEVSSENPQHWYPSEIVDLSRRQTFRPSSSTSTLYMYSLHGMGGAPWANGFNAYAMPMIVEDQNGQIQHVNSITVETHCDYEGNVVNQFEYLQ